ncbi:hypothetical protein ERO13_A03G170700v2 [Gossypium hirsutum]|uniref:Monosaccharide-sensing protein 2 n=1 Tax=Gossypium hirsutum TaxID=3635 RepID=A0A1U8MSH7_GOSHI|nr:monosaccharide-sensing protein 2 [Gossypium hirsutum]XP_016729775.2 monosaccharide-sensing protein 2 [Gossypium hirsutum]XP_016729776.2 monosaccharide-sensing protein 2 [Gossypium hirsutum]XP_040957558.1 monosaccharide-sensing protein 2 [Gossypium hirsutum]XP_040957560.1 monosaccharide-sensing protein 2 [Gossypium hirsutum]XP_040957562.1 monosaccharide-sensing protein 2 [Gossypium hirsutum]XP_040957565.1 monosaccharide-sensing protein 2 [Gossypium hirsutum]KAG4209043.1 hypothetical protei
MCGAVLVALTATIGNLLQGWDSATIAGAVMYIKKEFKLESEPAIEGLIVAMSLIGATCITTCSGSMSDWLGRRPILIISSLLYCLSGIVMLWAPNVPTLLLARLLDGLGIGLAVTLIPIYISETAPPEIRGFLNTLPLFSGCLGMFLSYCMVFGMSLTTLPNWRLMLGALSIPSLVYLALTVFFLPESPRWLVSKGRMSEARKVLQRIRGREDVSGEMALLVEGLGVGGETSIEEYLISPISRDSKYPDTAGKDRIKLYGPEEGLSWTAKPVTGQKSFGLLSQQLLSQQPSAAQSPLRLVDPLVTLLGSAHEKLSEAGSVPRNTLFPFVSSFSGLGGHQVRAEESDEESVTRESDDEQSDDSDDNLRTPLISWQASAEKDMVPTAQESVTSARLQGPFLTNAGESLGSMGIGGGWQLAWKWSEREGGFQRIYMHEESVPGLRQRSIVSPSRADVLAGYDYVPAAALVSHPALYSKELMKQHPVGPAIVHPAEAAKGPSWNDLLEPGVKHALVVGVGIEMLQQFSGMSSILYYIPEILELAGVRGLLSNTGLSSSSASLLISCITTFFMLPSITVAMRFVDVAGRRRLLLITVPLLALCLFILVIGSIVKMGSVVRSAISTVSVVLSCCVYVMGFGPIPSILCAEIFPTRVRGTCIAIVSFVYWISNIIVAYSLPVLLKTVGLAGVFGMFGTVCLASFVFVFLKVPETKGMPLEVITEFFSVGSKQAITAKNTGYSNC